MKKRKLKKFVLPTFYIIILGVVSFGITMLSSKLLESQVRKENHYNYTMSVFNESDETEPTMDEVPTQEEKKEDQKVMLPFNNEKVKIAKYFYNSEDDSEKQQNSLIYYENTYMPNTGILYESEEIFDVLAVLQGTVKDIKEDEILGKVLTLESNNVTTIYYTLGEIKVKVGDTVNMGDTIATSGISKIESNKQTLLFEVYMNVVLTNPETLFEKNISELN